MQLTPTETLIIKILSDGKPHSRSELMCCLDSLSKTNALQAHISKIRRKLPDSEAIICEYHQRRIYYRHIVLLSHKG